MRKIKFRAWDKECQHMLTWEKNIECVKDAIPDDMGDEWTERCVLMQFTGLKDANGKEIYEGDIVRYNELIPSTNEKQKLIQGADAVQIDEIGKVVWDDEGCSFDIEMKDIVRGFNARGDVDMEVIGNIWEHAHLLNQGDR